MRHTATCQDRACAENTNTPKKEPEPPLTLNLLFFFDIADNPEFKKFLMHPEPTVILPVVRGTVLVRTVLPGVILMSTVVLFYTVRVALL